MGGIVPVVNLDGIDPGELTIDGPTLAKIYLGEIKKWNDPAIKKLNASAKLPDQAIAVVHRSDGSGTTFNLRLTTCPTVSADWKAKVGVNTSVEWPIGIGAKGNEGVANNVANTKGSIGYVEYAYAKQNKLTYHQDDQQGRQDSCSDLGSVPGGGGQCRLEVAARLSASSSPTSPAINPGRCTARPSSSSTSSRPDAAATGEALKFFAWAYKNGAKMAEELDYVPMPDNVVKD